MAREEGFPIEPLMDRVFIRKDDMDVVIDEQTGTKFHVPQSVKGRAQTGTVVAVGPGYLDTQTGKFYPMTVKVGDRVFVHEFTGTIIDYDGHKVHVFMEKEIVGRVIDNEEKSNE